MFEHSLGNLSETGSSAAVNRKMFDGSSSTSEATNDSVATEPHSIHSWPRIFKRRTHGDSAHKLDKACLDEMLRTPKTTRTRRVKEATNSRTSCEDEFTTLKVKQTGPTTIDTITSVHSQSYHRELVRPLDDQTTKEANDSGTCANDHAKKRMPPISPSKHSSIVLSEPAVNEASHSVDSNEVPPSNLLPLCLGPLTDSTISELANSVPISPLKKRILEDFDFYNSGEVLIDEYDRHMTTHSDILFEMSEIENSLELAPSPFPTNYNPTRSKSNDFVRSICSITDQTSPMLEDLLDCRQLYSPKQASFKFSTFASEMQTSNYIAEGSESEGLESIVSVDAMVNIPTPPNIPELANENRSRSRNGLSRKVSKFYKIQVYCQLP